MASHIAIILFWDISRNRMNILSVAKTRFTHADDVFCATLKEFRRSKGITQLELAARLRVPQSYVSKYENGERSLNFVETALVCDALGTELEAFAREFVQRLPARGRLSRQREGD